MSYELDLGSQEDGLDKQKERQGQILKRSRAHGVHGASRAQQVITRSKRRTLTGSAGSRGHSRLN